MGLYINTGNEGFRSARNGEYVDKSLLIDVVNAALNSERQFMCVSRARRFGKSMAARMLNAYYDHSCRSEALFADLKIAERPSFKENLNRFPVLFVDMTNFITRYRNRDDIVEHIEHDLVAELESAYPDVRHNTQGELLPLLNDIVAQAEPQKFIMIIDEWDAILREFPAGSEATTRFIDFLRLLFKSGNSMSVFACVYMTGILPIKKYNTQSALNNFEEFTMATPGKMAPYFGFTDSEVVALCEKHEMDVGRFRDWYDGYRMNGLSVYNPLSVIRAVDRHEIANYWSKTGTYETVASYINLNYQGLKDDIVRLLAGDVCNVDIDDFQNDVNEVMTKNDVLVVLLHLGYLAYDIETSKCRIPNKEIALEFEKAIKDASNWDIVADALRQSEQLLAWTIEGDAQKVEQAIDRIHSDNTSILQYNDENSLACVLSIAYYAARNKYAIVREMPTGKGFADLVLVPRRGVDMPALVLELKYDHDARTALNQIQAKHYTDSLVDYVGEVVLVGINYDKKTKRHQCVIGRIEKGRTSDKFPINAGISDKTSDKFPINTGISDKFPIKSRISDKLATIVEYMEAHQGTVTQVEVAAMFGVSDRQARNYLNLLIAQGKVEPLGANKNRIYKLLTC